MKFTTLKVLTSVLAFSAIAQAAELPRNLNTEENEVVCQLNDLMATKVFIDRDSTFDGKIGELSSKVLEMPTKNARGDNYKLFQTELVSVSRARCPDCRDTQIILYKSEGVNDVINLLETNGRSVKITRNVDANGNPQTPSFVDEGTCQLNEVE